MANYVTFAGVDLQQLPFDYAAAYQAETMVAGAGQVEISLPQLDLVVQQLDMRHYVINGTTEAQIRSELRAKAWNSLNLPASHPVKGVYVVGSRPVSGGVVWQSDDWYWIYPTTTANNVMLPTFAFARQDINGIYVAFAHAGIAAIHQ